MSLQAGMGWRGLWRSRRKNIPVPYAAALSLFMTGNAVSARKGFRAGMASADVNKAGRTVWFCWWCPGSGGIIIRAYHISGAGIYAGHQSERAGAFCAEGDVYENILGEMR